MADTRKLRTRVSAMPTNRTVRPGNLDEYIIWLKTKLGVDVSSATQTYYETVTQRILHEIVSAEAWIEFIKKLPEINSDYYAKTGYKLFIADAIPELQIKPYKSTLEKSYRH